MPNVLFVERQTEAVSRFNASECVCSQLPQVCQVVKKKSAAPGEHQTISRQGPHGPVGKFTDN